MAVTCKRCGVKKGLLDALSSDIGSTDHWYCQPCTGQLAVEKEQKEKERLQRVTANAAKVIVTTTPSVNDFRSNQGGAPFTGVFANTT
jgi:hypothetical protein